MSDKKHIDRLFQEKFKDFEVKPSANVWAGIQNKMEQSQEKTKTRFPIWLRFAGIAAALVLLFTVGNLMFNNVTTETYNSTIVDTKSKTDSKSINNVFKTEDINTNNTISTENINTSKDNNGANNENKSIDNTVVVSSKNNLKTNKISEVIKNKVTHLSVQSPYKKGASKENNKKTNASLASQNSNNSISNANSVTVNSDKENVFNAFNNSQKYVQSHSINKTNDSASNVNYSSNTVTNNDGTPINNTISNSTNTKNTIANNTSVITNQNETNTKATAVLDNNSATSTTTIATTNNEKEEEKLMEPDSANSSNTIEEALAKNEDLNEKEENVNRWSVNANIAPVYYNTLGKGSHIDDQFIDNPKNGEINTSYGINVGYALNSKLKVRTGINKLNLSYDTANVIVYKNAANTFSTSSLRNINFVPTNEGQNISVLSTSSFSVQEVSSLLDKNLNAALSQRLSYVEVPLELEYVIVKNRFGLNLIGGFSTFFLDDNEVVTEVENRKTEIGKANNINNVSFSANAGIGIDYRFNNAVKFSLEPTFKYQINAYNKTSGNFNPYIIGVYTGISYKF